MRDRSSIIVTYVLPALAVLIIPLLVALGQTYHTPVFEYLVIVYIVAIMGAMFAKVGLAFRKRMKEVHEYLKNVKTGALERLSSADLSKLIEKDTEYVRELVSIQKRQLRNVLITLGTFFAIFIIYSIFFSKYVATLFSGIKNTFWRTFLQTLTYFSIFVVAWFVMVRALKIHPMGAMVEIPYTPMRSLVIYRDAIILDEIYLLRAPIKAKKVVINERRKYIEIELEDDYAKQYQLRKIRLYVRSPKDLWNDVLSKMIQVTTGEKTTIIRD